MTFTVYLLNCDGTRAGLVASGPDKLLTMYALARYWDYSVPATNIAVVYDALGAALATGRARFTLPPDDDEYEVTWGPETVGDVLFPHHA